MKGKIIIAVLMLVGGTIIVISRFVNSAAGKQSQNNLINRIKRKPSEAESYAEKLDIVMDKRENINRQAFELIKSKIQASPFIGSYKILHTTFVGESLLFFTELIYTDFDVTFTGHADDVKKKAHHNFLMKHIPSSNELELSSDMFLDAVNKSQKQDFIKALFESAA